MIIAFIQWATCSVFRNRLMYNVLGSIEMVVAHQLRAHEVGQLDLSVGTLSLLFVPQSGPSLLVDDIEGVVVG